jgi:hypothetical protein
MRPGSCAIAGEVAAAALLRMGATNLQAKLAREYASRGDFCWLTDRKVSEETDVKRWDGRPYHRESIGRARRQMARRGWIGSERVMPFGLPKGAKHRTTHGTTNKWVAWKTLGVKNPMTRGERRERVKQQIRADHVERVSEGPRRRTVLEPSFVALVAGIGQPSTPAASARRERTPRHRNAETQRELEKRAAAERARFAAWRAEHDDPDERGPPD